MKSILGTVAIVLFCSLQAFAGPEEHIDAQTCYALNSKSASPWIPSRICIEEIGINNVDDVPSLKIYSYFNQSYFEGMTLTYLARHNENGYSFRAANILAQSWEAGCGSSEKVVLEIIGRTDNSGEVEASALQISVKHETLNDVCHSRAQITTYEYSKE